MIAAKALLTAGALGLGEADPLLGFDAKSCDELYQIGSKEKQSNSDSCWSLPATGRG